MKVKTSVQEKNMLIKLTVMHNYNYLKVEQKRHGVKKQNN
jgi:uncharacterized protein YkvS